MSLEEKTNPHPLKYVEAHNEETGGEKCEPSRRELNCLYEITRLVNLYGFSSPDLFTKLVSLIPTAFQFPKITCSRILIDGKEFQTGKFDETPWILNEGLYLRGKTIGKFQICYLEERPLEFQGPFLREEVVFVHSMAEYIVIVEECRRTEQDRKHLENENQLMKLEAISKLSRGIAHKFNNLLTIINGYSRYILDHLEHDNPIYPDITEINKAGIMGAESIKRLVTFSGPTKLNPQYIDLNQFVLDLKSMLDSIAGENIELVIRPSDLSAGIYVDKGQLTQVLLSLADNAKEAMSGRGKLTVETSSVIFDEGHFLSGKKFKSGGYITLTVSDKGNGINKDLQGQVFDPFYTTKGKRMGVGLGLAASQRFLDQCNGYITVNSKPAEGTQFTLFFPYQWGEADSDSTKTGFFSEIYKGDETILIVEQDEKVMNAIAKTLANHGYRTQAVTSATESIDTCKSTPSIDLLVTNIIAPEMSGFMLFQKLRMTTPGLRALFMTDYKDQMPQLANKDSDKHIIHKPLVISELLFSVKRILKKTRKKTTIPHSYLQSTLDAKITPKKVTLVLSKTGNLRKEVIDCLKVLGHPAICYDNGTDLFTDLKTLSGIIGYVIIDPYVDEMSYYEYALEASQINAELGVIILCDSNTFNHIEIPVNAYKLKLPITRTKLEKALGDS